MRAIGKPTSLLSALLGDMKHVSGNVYAAGALAYVPQTAWIPNDTVRNNVLFGKAYDEDKYRRVLAVCRLERDLEVCATVEDVGAVFWERAKLSRQHVVCRVFGAWCFVVAVGVCCCRWCWWRC